MKINPMANPNVLASYAASKPAPTRQKPGLNRDEVSFSDDAINFSKTLEKAREGIEVRTTEEKEHIASVTDAVRQGTYRIESDKIAEKILESVFRH